jgi:large subunit ribosomal protein L18
MNNQNLKKKRQERRKKHIRKRIHGSEERLRLSIYKSLGHIYAQIINDDEGKTLVSASSIDKELKAEIKPETTKMQQSKMVGALLGKRAVESNLKKVAYDRNGFLYHGRVKALAEAAREAGLDF